MMIVVLRKHEKGDEDWRLLLLLEANSKGYFGSYSEGVAEEKIERES